MVLRAGAQGCAEVKKVLLRGLWGELRPSTAGGLAR
jgi:hypothetical protein